MAGKENKPQEKPIEVMAEPARLIPKLAGKVTVAKSQSSGNVILGFITNLPGEQAYLIERIVIDKKTAEDLSELLKENTGAK